MSSLAVADPVLLDFAADVGPEGRVAVAGGRTRWGLGGELRSDTRVLAAPTGIVAYAASEMTVQVRAGTPVAELDAALAEHGQRCALPARGGTVGGAVAVGENVVDQLGRGRLRDAVLQVRYVSAEGDVVTGGGPVVKNVTGYNLPKLMTGSLGTLGLLVELILRTNPIPAASRWLAAEDVDPAAVEAALYAPGAVLWDGATTWVLLEGHGPDLASESNKLASFGVFTEVDGPPELPPHRWSLTPEEAADFSRGAFVSSIGVGTVWADSAQKSLPDGPGVAAVAARIKKNFDPTGRLNPGRTAGC
ncbi:MAG: FAD-binding protein [Acidimicrobiales bacterium]|jgi:FAD/FMN-containing dehydrogenase|nr:FAD-binding protein [Acidimicrobiales bacterium]